MYDGRTTRHEKPLDKEELLEMIKALTEKVAALPEKKERAVALPPPPPEKHIPEDQIQTMLKMTEASLRLYGTPVPPREVFLMTGSKVCPRCGEKKQIATEFGTKTDAKGNLKPQSWCLSCRNSPASHPTRQKFGRRK
jgi:hypothetical protein